MGGGLVGCEVALYLAGTGRKVTVVEMMDRLAPDTHRMYRTRHAGRNGQTGHPPGALRPLSGDPPRRGAGQLKSGEEQFLAADSVCYSLGMKARKELADSLKAAVPDSVPVFEVGDCAHVGKVGDAVDAGYKAALQIL